MSRPACSQCSASLPESALLTSGALSCPACQARLQVEVFPALHRPALRGNAPERILVEGEASCFYHPEKRAVVPCDACGRFLCALCDLELNAQHLCPACLQSRQEQNQMPGLVNRRALFDSAALLLVLSTSLLFCLWPLWIISAPAAIFLGILSWTKPGSILRRNRWRAIVAVVLAVLQLAGFCLIVWGMMLGKSW